MSKSRFEWREGDDERVLFLFFNGEKLGEFWRFIEVEDGDSVYNGRLDLGKISVGGEYKDGKHLTNIGIGGHGSLSRRRIENQVCGYARSQQKKQELIDRLAGLFDPSFDTGAPRKPARPVYSANSPKVTPITGAKLVLFSRSGKPRGNPK